MRRARVAAVAVFLALAPPAAAAKVALVVADGSAARTAAARAEADVSVLVFERALMADPIAKGRFVAAVQAAGQAVAAAGGGACAWLDEELEGVSVECVTPYDGGQVLDFARASGWNRVAAVHMKGYEKVYARLRVLARARGIELVPVRIGRLKELTAVLPRELKSAKAVWILGDPRLTGGPAFDYIVEKTLARRVPLIAPGADLVRRGAFLGADRSGEAMLRHAVDAANAASKGAPAAGATEPGGGRLVVNRVLARRWGVRVPGGAP